MNAFIFSETFYYLNKTMYYYNKMNEESAMTKYDATYFRNHKKVIQYIHEHLGIHSDEIERQINAYNVSGICIGIFHEMRHGKRIWQARKHIKKEIEETMCLDGVNCEGLPFHAKLYIFLLKRKMYMLTLVLTKGYLLLKG